MTEFNNNKPIFRQIADKICDDVTYGVYPEEARLPSVREYAASMQVNANTVMRTYDMLAQQGIIYNKRGIGFFVATGAIDVIKHWHQQAFFSDEINYFFSRLKVMDVDPDTLARLYNEYLTDQANL